MAAHWDGPLTGLVVAPHGQVDAPAIGGIAVLGAAHPVPDAAGVAAARRIGALLDGLQVDDLVIALLSGGGSALLVDPAPGLTLADKQQATRQLLASGLPIGAINCVRSKLSAIKGGRLACRAAPAVVHALAISDVPGDDFSAIASGPFSADPTTLADARAAVAQCGAELPLAVLRRLADPAAETPKPGDAAFKRVTTTICARSADALAAAARVLAAAGYDVLSTDDRVDSDAAILAQSHARRARELLAAGRRAALVSGGETTVRVTNPHGRGGRNTTYLLALALALDGIAGVTALAADTDGIDGTETNAGAFLDAGTCARSRERGLDATALLAANDAWVLFSAVDALFVTGPTGTNANDLRIVLVDPPSRT